MISFERELAELRDAGRIDPTRADNLLRIERREVFSLHYEIRVATYMAVALIVTGVGILLKNNFERIGPLAILGIIAAAAACLYAWTLREKRKGTFSTLDEYLALLASLLTSAGLGYAEQQFDLLGKDGFDHLLILAIFHALMAYLLGSRLVLSVALTSLAGWLGIDRRLDQMFDASWQIGKQALLCSAIILGWRVIHERSSKQRDLDKTFEHFAVNLAGIGACAFAADEIFENFGIFLVVAFVAVVGSLAVKRRSELFLLYALGYGLTGLSMPVVRHLEEEVLVTLYLLLSFVAAITILFVAHIRWKFDK